MPIRKRPTPPFDATIAWSLVRAVHPGLTRPLRVHHDRFPSVWVQVYPGGGWEASPPASDEARLIFDLFLPLQAPAALVVAQTGQSLDSRIATQGGHSHYVTGPADILRLHRLRALVDAVVVGAGTVASDDPRLTVRAVEGAHPMRVVLDPDGRLDHGHHVFTDGAAPTLVIRRDGARGAPPPGVDVVALPPDADGRIDPRRIVQVLAERGQRRLLIEGGGLTVSGFLDADAIDRLHVTVAPLIIGSGRPAFTLAPVATLDDALRPRCRTFPLGDDMLFDLDLRRLTTPPAATPTDPRDPRSG